MADLINRDILKASLRESYDELMKIRNGLKYSEERQIADAQLNTFAEAIMRVKEQPTIDAVPVVRCNDCVFLNKCLIVKNRGVHCIIWNQIVNPDNGYCNYGKRSDDVGNG